MFSLTGIIVLFVIYAVRFILIGLEWFFHRSKNYKLKLYGINTISEGNNYRIAITGLAVTLATFVLGSFAGAVASAAYTAPERDVFSESSSALSWFIDVTIRKPGAIGLVVLIMLVLEIVAILIYVWHFNSKSNPLYLDEIYGSFQIGELSKDALGEKFKKKLSDDLPKIFEKHPIVKKCTNLNMVNIWGLRKFFKKRGVSKVDIWTFCIKLLFLVLSIYGSYVLYINNNDNSVVVVFNGIITLGLLYFILFTKFIAFLELVFIELRMRYLVKSYLIVKSKRDYIENLLKG